MNNYSIQDTARQADELYRQRSRIENVHASVTILEERASRSGDYDIQWRLGRALFFLGQEISQNNSADSYFSRAISWCEQAVTAKPDRVEGHFWLGVNLAMRASGKRWFAALKHALRARRELQRAVKIDSSFHGAGPLRVLARLQHKMPPWLGGRSLRARHNYEHAIAIAPGNTVTRIYFAELLVELGEHDLGREHLESILNAPEDPDWAFEMERDRRIAREMLDRI